MTRKAPHHDTYHRPRRPWFFYYQEDSARGIDLALAKGCAWIDLDCQVTSDGVLVIAHGPRPLGRSVLGGFIDPAADGRFGPIVTPRDRYEDLTWQQIARLRSRKTPKDGVPYRIRRADELVPMALRKGLKVELEVKNSKITAQQLDALRVRIVKEVGIVPQDVQVKGFWKFHEALYAAHLVHFVTIALTHPGQRRLPASARGWLDFWRGRPPIWDSKR